SIISPTVGITVTSPMTVTGIGTTVSGQALVVRVLDGAGQEIGLDFAIVEGEAGRPGSFTATVAYTVPMETQPGRIQVYSLDPRDGAVAHLSSVVVTLPGAGLEAAVAQLAAAVEAKDYDELALLLSDPWVIGFYQSEGLTLDAEEALEQLEENYLGPGEVVVDPAVDVADLLGEDIIFSPDVKQVVYSTGWGASQGDDAFLLLVQDSAGFARWGGMLYVYEALRDYTAP
ncbi:MAG: Gmad2 immunoglobulin-like domain-containing protein, partial [Anaerolineae bacterium]